MSDPNLVACTLSAADRPAREAEFAALFTDLLAEDHSATTLRYRFSARPDTEARLRALSAAEQTCCAFLHFTIRVDDQLWWEIEAPDPATLTAIGDLLPVAGNPQTGKSPR